MDPELWIIGGQTERVEQMTTPPENKQKGFKIELVIQWITKILKTLQ